MAFGLSGSLSAYFMYIFALLCFSTEWQIKMLACLLLLVPFCHIISYVSSVFVINSLLFIYEKKSKGPGGACVRRRRRLCHGTKAQWPVQA